MPIYLLLLSLLLYSSKTLLPVPSEYAEQVEEEVDEIEIEGERAHQGYFLRAFAHVVGLYEHVLYLLRVIRREACEDEHAYVTNDKAEPSALYQERVYQRGDDESDEGHEEYAAQRRQVFLGEQADERHGGERSGGDEKHRGD